MPKAGQFDSYGGIDVLNCATPAASWCRDRVFRNDGSPDVRMTSFLAPYGNPDALQVARSLDTEVEALLLQASA